MIPGLVILTEIISPYRIPLFNALHERDDLRLHVIFLAETDPDLRHWRVYKEEIKFSHQVLPGWRKRVGRYNILLNRNVGNALVQAVPDAILCGGYNYMASWQALISARRKRVPFLLWSESSLEDTRGGHAFVEMVKAEFFARCNGVVVPGRSAHEYVRAQGIAEDRIFTAVNAVDNEFFANAASATRHESENARRKLDLPRRFFLFVGRLVRQKGVFDLLQAYAKLDDQLREQIGLVLIGDGPMRSELESRAASIVPGSVKFTGFVHQEDLGKYYGLAEMLVMPTYTDTWGLVVNEAMACGLPIVLSRIAGCAADLVTESWNGHLISPGDISSLTSAMRCIATQESVRHTMSENSLRRISSYSAKEWSAGVSGAIHTVLGSDD